MKRAALLLGAVLLVLFVAHNPASAAVLGKSLWSGLGSIADGIGTFASNLAK